MTVTTGIVAKAVPALLRGRVLRAVELAQERQAGPATAAACWAASSPPVGIGARGFTTVARRVLAAQTGPDADGCQLHRGVDRKGFVRWWVSRADEPSPATAVRIAEGLERLGLSRPDETPLRTVARLLSEAPRATAPASPPPRVAPESAPLRNEPAPLAQAAPERAPETPDVLDTCPPSPEDPKSVAAPAPRSKPPSAPPARDALAELFGVAPTSPTDDDTAALRAALE